MKRGCFSSVYGRRPVADSETRPLRIYCIAGEPSGDLLAGRLIAAIRRATDRPVEFFGIGGETMSREGLQSLFPIVELSVMGIAEILPRVFHLLRRMRETAEDIRRIRPDVVVTIDAPAFCFGVLKRLGDFPVRKIHYVAPSVWAWRPGRVHKYARVFDHLMALLPFEPPYFEREGLKTSFVGHSVVEAGIDKADGAAFRENRGISAETPLLCVLPGSRLGEVTRHFEAFSGAVDILRRRHSGLSIVVPTIPGLAELIRAKTAGWSLPVIVVETEQERYAAMVASDCALAASGTVALELAMAKTPSVIAYRIHPLSYLILKGLIKVEFVNLVNLLLGRRAVPEFLQGDCRSDLLAEAVDRLLNDAEARAGQVAAYEEAVAKLVNGNKKPSDAAAEYVLGVIGV
jgi:lipid-A-disaccharide synthase